MKIEREHAVAKQEAVRRIDTFLDELMRRDFPGGVKVQDPVKSWVGDVMNFSFRAKKGFIGTTISGVIHVTDRAATVESELPTLVKTFVAEDKIRELINRQFDSLFPQGK